jgi:cytochrome c-type biogenesis protein CcmE
VQKNKKKFIIAGVILAVALGYLGFLGLRNATTYYYTVTQFEQQQSAIGGKIVRINGTVGSDYVPPPSGSTTVRFNISEGNSNLPVVYHGGVPDGFDAGREVVVEGKIDGTGTFQATSIITKCPSKYAPA